MNTLVVHHTYANGSSFDVSDNRNHGRPTQVTQGIGSSFTFASDDSRIDVIPSESLTDLHSIRARVRFFHTPKAGGGRRHNLMEGHLSFALFINPDRSIQGTILDRSGNWRGAASGPGIVSPNSWHQVEFVHDGISQCLIYLNGALVASAHDVEGPVRSVGPRGLTIGHWPEPDPAYTFEGHIGEVQLYKYDPKEEVKQLINPCCIDREALDKVREELRRQGVTGEKLMSQAQGLISLAFEITAAVRMGDADETVRQKQYTTQAMSAFMRKDGAGMRSAFGQIAAQVAQNLNRSQIQSYGEQLTKQVGELPIKPEGFMELAQALCWEHGIITDPQELLPKRRRPDRPPDRGPDRRRPHRNPDHGPDC